MNHQARSPIWDAPLPNHLLDELCPYKYTQPIQTISTKLARTTDKGLPEIVEIIQLNITT